MAEFPALPFFTDAYLADTRHLTTEEHGAYILLLMCAWRTRGCALKADDRTLARIAGLSPTKWKRLKPVLAEFFTTSGGVWRQKKLQYVYETVSRKVAQNRLNGARGGRVAAARKKAGAVRQDHYDGFEQPAFKPNDKETTIGCDEAAPALANALAREQANGQAHGRAHEQASPLANKAATKTKTKTKENSSSMRRSPQGKQSQARGQSFLPSGPRTTEPDIQTPVSDPQLTEPDIQPTGPAPRTTEPDIQPTGSAPRPTGPDSQTTGPDLHKAVAAAAGLDVLYMDQNTVLMWQAAGADDQLDILPTVQRLRDRLSQRTGAVPSSLAYYSKAILQARDARLGASKLGQDHAASRPAKPAARMFDISKSEDWRQFLGDKSSRFRGDYLSQNWRIPAGHPQFKETSLGPDPRVKFNPLIPADVHKDYARKWGWMPPPSR